MMRMGAVLLGAAACCAAERHPLHSLHLARMPAVARGLVPPPATPGGTPPRPQLPLDWSSQVVYVSIVDGKKSTMFDGQDLNYYQENSKSRFCQVSNWKNQFAPASAVGTALEWINYTSYHVGTFSGVQLNGQTLLQSSNAPYQTVFDWFQYAVFNGTVMREGVELNRWALQAPNVDLWLLITKDGIPVVQNTTTNGVTTELTFINFKPNVTDPSLWEGFNKEDYLHPKPCAPPADPKPVNQTMYIFHPKNDFNITGQDLADALGDVFFTCEDFLLNQSSSIDHSYAWITQWEIELVPRWGQYQNCNGYPPVCLGANDWWVGHEAANGLAAPEAGQCQTNPEVGEWWSMPAGGLCKEGHRPGDGACTWRKSRRVKTIDSTCLLATGYKAACLKDKRCPFPSATALFNGAFASTDPKRGGCPDLGQ
eukprot:TRINITY_DN1234_c0_g1_i1.p1 TRINITY_DN1234_c0_g1~~TRINITY_DN1234_c0_g1_i1.p1  ORF type:complete len:449 (+),score=108.01 TRINITY_DN1234_c0_g1_i1:73-1347(+)